MNAKKVLWSNLNQMDDKLANAIWNKKPKDLRDNYRNIINTLNKNYTVDKGFITLYHGNVYNYSNCEVLELHKPDSIYRQRVDDVFQCWQNKIQNESIQNECHRNNCQLNCPQFTFVLNEDKAMLQFNDIGDRNAPIEYKFELKRND